ncbi:pancreatic secretory granule membrane major glycoprotein GP2-like [Paralichthys olivaceus]|uniref:pancreatic secretory granule membrane major glycoprotein GP2-like n=1 Tax=Paralichthys olivaceus TaxID=8255 RepID=UPI00374FE463
MLLVLVYLAALSQLSAAASSTLDFQCAIKFYGRDYNRAYVNFTNTKAALCFKGHYPATQENDCFVVIPKGTLQKVQLFNRNDVVLASVYSFPGLVGTSYCEIQVLFLNPSNMLQFKLSFRYFVNQSIAILTEHGSSSADFTQLIDGVSQVEKLNTNPVTNIGACRHSGAVYKPNTTTCNPDNSSVTCSSLLEVTVNPCGGVCKCPEVATNITCTVTGSTVINFFGNATSIPDRCAYTLISHSGVQLLAVFQDRRRKDVSLLDHVILRMDGPGVNISLGQGGRVQLNSTTLSLSSSPLSRHGVDFYKDQTGVTAKFNLSKYTTSVFFDGYTAQIHTTVLGKPNMMGLCGNSSGPLSEVRTEFSSRSCKRNYSESADRTINCTRMTERCNLLMEAPFTTCHNHTHPEPFITACTNTLCKYPVVDGFSQCQFLDAYVRACNFQTNDTLEGWRSKAGCSPPQAFCQDTLCSAHEFCAENISGGTSCFCRAIFASKYRSTGALGDPTVCDQNSASVSLVGCLLKEKGIDYSELHLNNQNCRGQMNNVTQMVTFKFDTSNPCGTVVMANNSHIMYKNSIVVQNSSSIITRQDHVNIDFSCFYNQPDIRSTTFRIIDSSVVQQIISGAWNYTLTMKVYSDAGRTKVIEPSTDVQLQQIVWVELKTDGLDGKLMAVVTDSCWATNEKSPNASLRYNLIVNGCSNPADQTVKMMDNGLGTSNYFSFNLFEFSGKSSDVYLHCKVKLCVKKGNTCTKSCGDKRRRRSTRARYEDGNPAFISMAWTK